MSECGKRDEFGRQKEERSSKYYNCGCVCIGRSNPLKVGFAKDYKKSMSYGGV